MDYTEIFIVIVIVLLLIAASICGGCSYNTSKESVELPVNIDGKTVMVEFNSEISQLLFLYYTKNKPVHKLTPFTEMYVGGWEAHPDANSISAISEGVIDGIKRF